MKDSESRSTGARVMSTFHQLSAGNTCRPARFSPTAAGPGAPSLEDVGLGATGLSFPPPHRAAIAAPSPVTRNSRRLKREARLRWRRGRGGVLVSLHEARGSRLAATSGARGSRTNQLL